MSFPEDLKYTAEHEWVRVVGEGDSAVLRIGITSYAQDALGDIVFVSTPSAGTTVDQGQAIGEVESTKSVSDVYSPLAGTVTGANDQLEANPELVNSDPYGEGWMLELAPEGGVAAALAHPALLTAEQYAALVS